MVVDNLSRRNIDTELGCDSLTPIQSPDVSFSLRMLIVCTLIFYGGIAIYMYWMAGSYSFCCFNKIICALQYA